MQAGVETVDVDPDIVDYCVALAAGTRSHPAVEVGASPRGSLALLLVARALAVLDGRDFVTPEDVKEIAVSALAHRITLNPQTWASGTRAADVVRVVLGQVPGPAADGPRPVSRPATAVAGRPGGRPLAVRRPGAGAARAAGRPPRHRRARRRTDPRRRLGAAPAAGSALDRALRAGEQVAGSGQLNAVVQVTGGAEPDLLTVRGDRTRDTGPAEGLVVGRGRDYAASMTTVRTGRRQVFWLEVRHGGPDRLWVSEPTGANRSS